MKISHFLALVGLLLSTNLAADPTFWTQSYDLEQANKYEEAIDLLKQKKATQSDVEFISLRLGWLHYLNTDYSKSISHYNAALKINPHSISTKVSLLSPLAAQNRWRDVAHICSQILEVAPWNYEGHLFLMKVHNYNMDWPALQKRAQRLTKKYPTAADPLVYLARANLQLGKTSPARAAYRKLHVLYPQNLEASNFLSRQDLR